MIQIRAEAEEIVQGRQPRDNNLLRNAPHPIAAVIDSNWNRYAAKPSSLARTS